MIDRASCRSGVNGIQKIAGIGCTGALVLTGAVTGMLTPAALHAADKKDASAVFKPVDEGIRDPAFFLFRARLQRAIAARDADAVAQLMHSKVQMGSGTDIGRKPAMQHLKDRPVVWGELAQVLAMGGRFVDGAWTDGRKQRGFVAPYTYFAAASGNKERQVVVVTAAHVNLRKSPSVTAQVVTKLSHQIVYRLAKAKPEQNAAGPKTGSGWVNVETLGGRQGWISRTLVRTPGGYRAYFLKEGGRWRLAAFTPR